MKTALGLALWFCFAKSNATAAEKHLIIKEFEETPVSLLINDEPSGDIDIFVPLNVKDQVDPVKDTVPQNADVEISKKIKIESKAITAALLGKVDASLIKKLQDNVLWDIESLDKLGIQIVFDEPTLELRLNLSMAIRKTQNIPLQVRKPIVTSGTLLQSSDFSAFSNFFADQSFEKDSRLPFRLDSDFAFQLRKWVLEGNWTALEKSAPVFSRRDVRIVRDFPSKMARFEVGDISYPIGEYQTFRPTGGIAFFSRFETQPYFISVPTSSEEFQLRDPTNVEVWLNGKVYRTFSLKPGSYRFSDLPLSPGKSLVEYHLTGPSGRTEVIRRSQSLSPIHLAKGLHRYSYSFGFPSSQVGANYHYDTSRPTISAVHSVGLTNAVTPGLGFQVDSKQGVIEQEGLLDSPAGLISINFAESNTFGKGSGGALKLKFSVTDYPDPLLSSRSFSVAFESRTERFFRLGEDFSVQPMLYDIGADFSQELGLGFGLGLGGDYQITRRSQNIQYDSFRTQISLNRRWSSKLQTTVLANRSRDVFGNNNWGAFAFLTLSLDEGRQNVSITGDSQSPSVRADWAYRSKGQSDRFDLGAGSEIRNGSSNLSANIGYLGQRFQSSLSSQVSSPWPTAGSRLISDDNEVRTNARVATALAYAGGRFAISRPIGDGFAIFGEPSGWDQDHLGFNVDSNGDPRAKTSFFGPAVFSDLGSYEYHSIVADTGGLSDQSSLRDSYFTIQPTYKGGTGVTLDLRRVILISGRMVSRSGQPLPLKTGNVIQKGDLASGSFEFFTDRDGKFEIEVSGHGEFDVNMGESGFGSFSLKNVSLSTSRKDVGDLKVSIDSKGNSK